MLSGLWGQNSMGSASEMHILLLVRLPPSAGPFLKRGIRWHRAHPCSAHPHTSHGMEKALPLLYPTRWMPRQVKLPEQHWVQTLRSSCGPNSTWRTYFHEMELLRILCGSDPFQNFLYFLWRVALWAEWCVALLPDFLNWEIEGEVTLMASLLPEGSIKW